MKVITIAKALLLVLSITGTVQAASSSLRLSKRMVELFQPLIVGQVATVDSSEQLARVVNNFWLRVALTRLNYQRHLSKADDIIEQTNLRSRWQEWAVATKGELIQLVETRQHFIDRDILASLNAIDDELQHVYIISH